jgi:hypothetical protein
MVVFIGYDSKIGSPCLKNCLRILFHHYILPFSKNAVTMKSQRFWYGVGASHGLGMRLVLSLLPTHIF